MVTEHSVAHALAALGHETRLMVFRLLVRAGEGGMIVGDISKRLDMAPSTLAHHLRALVDAGLVIQERQGRQIVNRVDYAVIRGTVDFLLEECCADAVDCVHDGGAEETAA
ncbi:ArsR/SmtB family transcription factor [Amaricoccus tamworthensis]|uniref:ArsR/SmtB family transcription factor n=1 Tax=Amaricoccus tamworthensis TaxID=57002 RepID=UPI003C7EC7CC